MSPVAPGSPIVRVDHVAGEDRSRETGGREQSRRRAGGEHDPRESDRPDDERHVEPEEIPDLAPLAHAVDGVDDRDPAEAGGDRRADRGLPYRIVHARGGGGGHGDRRTGSAGVGEGLVNVFMVTTVSPVDGHGLIGA